MKSVYAGPTSLEANMILNLLQQHGIDGRVEGEYLQGAVGGLQATDLVRVVVREEDYLAARQVISDWDAMQATTPSLVGDRRRHWLMWLLVLVVLFSVLGGNYWYGRAPLPVTGAHDNAPVNVSSAPYEQDRNGDGKIDSITHYQAGVATYSLQDDNFDGVFEGRAEYQQNVASYYEADLDGDGQTDYQMHSPSGVMNTAIISGKTVAGKTPRKRQTFRLGKLLAAEYDADGDGVFEKQYTYDFFEEPVR